MHCCMCACVVRETVPRRDVTWWPALRQPSVYPYAPGWMVSASPQHNEGTPQHSTAQHSTAVQPYPAPTNTGHLAFSYPVVARRNMNNSKNAVPVEHDPPRPPLTAPHRPSPLIPYCSSCHQPSSARKSATSLTSQRDRIKVVTSSCGAVPTGSVAFGSQTTAAMHASW